MSTIGHHPYGLATHQVAERIGKLADRADNFLAAANLPVRATLHVEGLIGGIQSLRDELRKLHIEMGAGNPWDESA